MMSNRNENKLQKKMDALNPLSAGIVFDKDNAWSSLQHRLDARKKKRMVLWYSLGTAACLLMLVIAFGLYRTTSVPAVPLVMSRHQVQPLQAPGNTPAHAPVIAVPAVAVKNTTITPAQVVKPVATVITKSVAIIQSAPGTIEPVSMPVAIAPVPQNTTANKLPVVNINDLQDLEQYERAREYSETHKSVLASAMPLLNTTAPSMPAANGTSRPARNYDDEFNNLKN